MFFYMLCVCCVLCCVSEVPRFFLCYSYVVYNVVLCFRVSYVLSYVIIMFVLMCCSKFIMFVFLMFFLCVCLMRVSEVSYVCIMLFLCVFLCFCVSICSCVYCVLLICYYVFQKLPMISYVILMIVLFCPEFPMRVLCYSDVFLMFCFPKLSFVSFLCSSYVSCVFFVCCMFLFRKIILCVFLMFFPSFCVSYVILMICLIVFKIVT